MMKKWINRILAVLVVAALAAAVYAAMRPKPMPVEIATATEGPFVETIDEDGVTRVKERFVVSAPLAGNLERIRLNEGDRVKTGTLLASIHPVVSPLLDSRSKSELEARVQAARAAKLRSVSAVETAKVSRDYARVERDRARQLREIDAATKSELDRTEFSFRSSRKQLEAAEFAARVADYEVRMAKAALARTGRAKNGKSDDVWRIESPVEGTVLRVLQESEGVVTPGAPLLVLADPSALEIVVDALTTDAVRIKPGAEVEIHHWGGEASLRGRVRLVEPSAFTKVSSLGVEEQRVNVVIEIADDADKWKSLGDGFRVEVRIVIFETERATKIPASALFRDSDRWAVYVVEGDVAKLRHVTIDRRNGLDAMVAAGLEPGARVVVHPGDNLEAGVRVRQR